MENEEKEHNMRHHNEKLEISFALMSTPVGVPIKVMKTCGFAVIVILPSSTYKR